MKKSWFLIPIFCIILIFSLLPASFLNAAPANLVNNGDFSDGSNYWGTSGTVSFGKWSGAGRFRRKLMDYPTY